MKTNYISRCNRFLITCLVSITFSLPSKAQTWTQTRGPGGGAVAAMVERNGTILVTTLGGLFRSTDNGDTWHRAMNGIPDAQNFNSLTTTTNYLWAANLNGFDDLYRSADNGLSWTPVSNQIGSFFISAIYGSHDTLYLGCDGCGVYRSVNEGGSFQNFNNGYPGSAFVRSFAQIGGTLFTGLVGNGGGPGVYRTSVTAANWVQVNAGLPSPMSVIDLAVKGNDLLVTGGNNNNAGLYRSPNLGTTWTALNTNLPAPEIPTKLAVSANNIYIGTDGDAPYRSADDGLTFQRVATGLKQTSVFSFLAGSAGVFVGYERGVARTTDNGANWQRKVVGLTVSSITSVYSNDNITLYATGRTQNIGSNDGVFSSTDGGQNWTSIDEGLQPNPNVNQIVKSGGNLILATDNNGMFIKTPADAAFRRPDVDAIFFYDAVLSLVTYGNYIFAGIAGNPELIRSADNGLTWTQANNGFRTDLTDQTTALYEKDGVIYAGGFDAVYKSTNLGVTWTLSNTGIYPGTTVNAFTSIGNDLYAATEGSGLYKSSDNGGSWSQVTISVNGSYGAMRDIITVNNTLYIANTMGVLKGENGGTSWSIMNGGLQYYNSALSITVFNNNLVLGTDETAVWTMSLGPVLAATFGDFAVNKINESAKLFWTTSGETNVNRFDVERSTDGNNFISIGGVAASGNPAGGAYNFVDLNPVTGKNYYRIVAVHADGSKKNTPVRSIDISRPEKVRLTISPNPLTSESIIRLEGNLSGAVLITAFDAAGRKVADLYSGTARATVLSVRADRRIFKAGIYVIRARVGNETVTQNLLVQ